MPAGVAAHPSPSSPPRLQAMPFLIYAAKLCPKGVEASMFSLFMGLSNFGSSAAE